MARIGATLTGTERRLLNRLADANAAATLNNLRIAAGQRVLSPRDDVSAFVTLSRFQARLSTATSTMASVTSTSSMVTQAQSTIDQIHTQLDLIRTELLTDETQGLTSSQRTASQQTIDTAIAQINTLASTSINGRRLLDGSAAFHASGKNSSQVRDLVVRSTGQGQHEIVGKQAKATYTGTNRYAVATASVKLTGNLGNTTISVSTSDTLEQIAQNVNDQSTTTGVIASVEGNTLTLASAQIGASQKVVVEVLSGTFSVSGVDAGGAAYGVDPVATSTAAISGSVSRAATQGQLTYTGSTSQIAVGDGGNLTITGKLGSAVVAVSDGELLSAVATKINNVSHQTGITAAAASDTLTFQTVDFGAAATLAVSTDSSFSVTGGNHDGTAAGTDMIAQINGISYAPAEPAQLRHREKTGLFAADASIRVTGYLGYADITITNGDTLAQIADAINAQKASTGVVANVDSVDLVLQSVLTGSTSQVTVAVNSGSFDTVSGLTTAAGSDATVPHAQLDGNRLAVNRNGFQFEIKFAAGFSGDFDPMTIDGQALTFALTDNLQRRSTLAISSLQADQAGGPSGRLTDLLTGGTAAGLNNNTSQAIRIVDETLGRLTEVEGAVDGFYNATVTTSSTYLTNLQTDLANSITATDGYDATEESLLLTKNQQLATNALAGLNILSQQRQDIVNMIKVIAGLPTS